MVDEKLKTANMNLMDTILKYHQKNIYTFKILMNPEFYNYLKFNHTDCILYVSLQDENGELYCITQYCTHDVEIVEDLVEYWKIKEDNF